MEPRPRPSRVVFGCEAKPSPCARQCEGKPSPCARRSRDQVRSQSQHHAGFQWRGFCDVATKTAKPRGKR
eukprot:12907256-Prorocentrum_lima.AAC.1